MLKKSRHTAVCCATQENGRGGGANYVSILTGSTKSWFSCLRSSMIFYLKNTKVVVEVPAYQGRQTTHQIWRKSRKAFLKYEWANFWVFPSFFSLLTFLHTWKNHCKSQTCTPIQLKFDTLVGRPDAIISINSGLNPYKILRVIYRSFA